METDRSNIVSFRQADVNSEEVCWVYSDIDKVGVGECPIE